MNEHVEFFYAVQRTETRRTSTTGAVAREVAAETRTGKEGAGTEKGEEAAEIVMVTARTADTDAGKIGKTQILRDID